MPGRDAQRWIREWDGIASFEQLSNAVCTAARSVSQADGATFVLRDGDKCFYADEDAIAPLWKGQRFPLVHCISGWAMIHRDVAVIPDISLDERIPIEAYRPTFVRSLAMIPIDPDNPIGAIGVYWCNLVTADAKRILAVQSVAAAAATMIKELGLDNAPWAPTFNAVPSPA